MKEYNEEDSKDNIQTNNVDELINPTLPRRNNQMISPFKIEENSQDDTNIFNKNTNDKSYQRGINFRSNNDLNNFNNNINSNNKQLSVFEDEPNQENIDYFNSLNENIQFSRYSLNKKQKEYLMPRDSTLISKIIDFFLNW